MFISVFLEEVFWDNPFSKYMVQPWRYDREGDTTLFYFQDFYLFKLIGLFIH